MSDFLPVYPERTVGSEAHLLVSVAVVADHERFGGGIVPVSIPTDQAYYWSIPWQRDIQESMEALNAGQYEDFNDPNDANDVARWLLANDDD
jgi:hypothetical protein